MAPEVLEELDLPQSPLRQDFLTKDIGDFLDGHSVAGQVIGGSTRSFLDAVSLPLP